MENKECPWPAGDHVESDFPCGERKIDSTGSDRIHSSVPGHVLIWYTRLVEAWTVSLDNPQEKGIRFRNGKQAKDMLRKAIRKDPTSAPWESTRHFTAMIEKCLECPKADWNDFAERVNSKLLKQ
ncbi:hypothetical protein AKJ62_03735 [candidate division MSBL1 archaeon SCGC-AAA259D14]|uniref:Uncharacterized protein n=1 Tax=candidate division MSBL1 archaeon SCGC-AAA259D14 TaxID=1698261 RepID=A0A133U4N9_9EURY|nr:hypothetical protein AKJ62_03735 [candidate division MSBL1 archaeon SCGC-AAA259D14]